MFRRIKKSLSLFLCSVIIISIPSSLIYAKPTDDIKLAEFIKKEESRVAEINNLYSKKQELYNEYFTSKDNLILTEISYIESQLYKLGVSDFSWNDMDEKLNSIGYKDSNNIVSPNVVIPPNSSNVKWSTYRYSTVIWEDYMKCR